MLFSLSPGGGALCVALLSCVDDVPFVRAPYHIILPRQYELN